MNLKITSSAIPLIVSNHPRIRLSETWNLILVVFKRGRVVDMFFVTPVNAARILRNTRVTIGILHAVLPAFYLSTFPP